MPIDSVVYGFVGVDIDFNWVRLPGVSVLLPCAAAAVPSCPSLPDAAMALVWKVLLPPQRVVLR